MTASTIPESVNAAVERADAGRAVSAVAQDVVSVLGHGEEVLEFSETSAPGFPTALAVTDRRVLVGGGPGVLDSLELAAITGLSVEGSTLTLKCLDQEVHFTGIGEKGTQRVGGAVVWALSKLDEPESEMKRIAVLESYDAWVDLMVSHQAGTLSDDELNRSVSELLTQLQWW